MRSDLPLPWVLAWRYMRRERSRMLRSTALAALAATSLGVMAMVVAMALMSGYTRDLEHKLIGLQGEVMASPLSAATAAEDPRGTLVGRLEEAAALPGVRRAGRVTYSEGALSGAAVPEGLSVVLRGVDAEDPILQAQEVELAASQDRITGALLGEELARRLEARQGDVLRLVILDASGRRPRFHYRSIRLAGTFSTGFAEFDASWVLVDRGFLVEARGKEGFEMVEFKLEDPSTSQETANAIEEVLGPQWVVQRFQHLNQDLFAALALQKLGLFIILALIVLVATFNVASTLVILVRERMRDIGVLGSLGLAPGRIWWSFTTYGLMLGAMGILTGIACGSAVAWAITEFELVRFGPEIAAIYFISSVPFRVEIADVTAIVAFSLGVTLAACSLPALRAARVRPASALRNE